MTIPKTPANFEKLWKKTDKIFYILFRTQLTAANECSSFDLVADSCPVALDVSPEGEHQSREQRLDAFHLTLGQRKQRVQVHSRWFISNRVNGCRADDIRSASTDVWADGTDTNPGRWQGDRSTVGQIDDTMETTATVQSAVDDVAHQRTDDRCCRHLQRVPIYTPLWGHARQLYIAINSVSQKMSQI